MNSSFGSVSLEMFFAICGIGFLVILYILCSKNEPRKYIMGALYIILFLSVGIVKLYKSVQLKEMYKNDRPNVVLALSMLKAGTYAYQDVWFFGQDRLTSIVPIRITLEDKIKRQVVYEHLSTKWEIVLIDGTVRIPGEDSVSEKFSGILKIVEEDGEKIISVYHPQFEPGI